MKKLLTFLLFAMTLSCMYAKPAGAVPLKTGLPNIEVSIIPGQNYLHKFPLFLFFSLRNPPQMALWAETIDGQFLDTLMVTKKISEQKWAKAPKDPDGKDEIRRPEALPVWEHRRATAMLEQNTLVDAITQATPKADFSVNSDFLHDYDELYLYFEVNHSTDFNVAYPADARRGEKNYNGGVMGSGQPALVYRAYVDFTQAELSSKNFECIGHSSPCGEDGAIYTDMKGIDSALSIIDSILLSVK